MGQSLNQSRMDWRPRGNHSSARELQGFAVVTGHQPAGLFHKDNPGRQVPGGKAPLQIDIEAPCSHVGQVEGRCASPAHAVGAMGEVSELCVVVVEPGGAVVGKTGRQKGIIEPITGRYRQGLVIAPAA